MLIIRMENEAGVGMYRLPGRLVQMGEEDRHPSIVWDKVVRPAYQALERRGVTRLFYYGFETIAQLRHWLYTDELIADLQRCGCGVSVYDVTDSEHYIGTRQAIFHKATAKRVAFFPDIEEGIATIQESPIFKDKL